MISDLNRPACEEGWACFSSCEALKQTSESLFSSTHFDIFLRLQFGIDS